MELWDLVCIVFLCLPIVSYWEEAKGRVAKAL